MARRSVTGQLNMFDFFSSDENGEIGEVEMVSLIPNFEEDEEIEQKPTIESESILEPEPILQIDSLVMSRVYEKNGEKIEVAYINYNKVRVKKGNAAPELHEFSNSKEAVDFYVGYMQEKEW